MIRKCEASDEFIGDGDKRCGKVFDDVDHSTICPHDPIGPKLSLEELGKLAEQVEAAPE